MYFDLQTTGVALFWSTSLFLTYTFLVNYFCLKNIIRNYKSQLHMTFQQNVILEYQYIDYINNIKSKLPYAILLIFKDVKMGDLFEDGDLYEDSLNHIQLGAEKFREHIGLQNEKNSDN